jgi:predicted mannosyl-3-phosphoglycerate phosphatase (HAD superfamily)
VILVSFDIDGTLEVGDPAGPIALALVAEAHSMGYIVGSASDRTVDEQRLVWNQIGVTPHFLGHKHHLIENTSKFAATRRVHIGDMPADEYYAKLAGFEFVHVNQLPARQTLGWIF